MRLPLVSVLLLSSCSILFPVLIPEVCEEGTPTTCSGEVLLSCVNGFEVAQDCAPGVCDAVALRCEVCGDGVLGAAEACDDGNTTDGDGCDGACVLEAVCGNKLVEVGEACDDGNLLDSDACTSLCLEAACGDGFLQSGVEGCDDGNSASGDGCDAACSIENNACGVVLGGQEVNPGDTSAGSNLFEGSCTGQGLPERVFSFTPPGNPDEFGTLSLVLISPTDQGMYVRTDCADAATELGCEDEEFGGDPEFLTINDVQAGVPLAILVDVFHDNAGGGFPDGLPGEFVLFVSFSMCGDGIINTGEVCDDGNNNGGDGCREDCKSNEVCGNGIVDANEGEECDDGNANNADACSNVCVANAAALCAAATPAQALNIGDTRVANSGISGPCFGPDGPESIFTFTPPADGTLFAQLHSTAEMELYLRTDCDDQATEIACVDGEDANRTEFLEAFVQAGVPLFLFVDGHFGEFAPFALEVSFEACGDGALGSNEACDDGNNLSGDGCSATCDSTEACGNGFIDFSLGEACDDGNNNDLDGCESDCAFICGANASPDIAVLNAANNHCYVGFDDLETWDDAQASCVSVGGHLIVFNDQAEFDLLAPFVSANFWIGLNDQTTEGTFAWVNGDAVGFTGFAAGQPDNQFNQDCVMMNSDGWFDEGCDEFFIYACELP